MSVTLKTRISTLALLAALLVSGLFVVCIFGVLGAAIAGPLTSSENPSAVLQRAAINSALLASLLFWVYFKLRVSLPKKTATDKA